MEDVKNLDLSEFENGVQLKLPWYKRLFTSCVSYVRYAEQVSKLRDAIIVYREEDKKNYESLKEFNRKNVELTHENVELKEKLRSAKVSVNTNASIVIKLKEELLECSKKLKDLEDKVAQDKETCRSYARETPTVDGPVIHGRKPVKSKNSLSNLTFVEDKANTKARISKNNEEFAYIKEYVETLTETEKGMMVHDILDVYANDKRLSERIERYYTDDKFVEDKYYLILRAALARKRTALKKYYGAVETFRKKGK